MIKVRIPIFYAALFIVTFFFLPIRIIRATRREAGELIMFQWMKFGAASAVVFELLHKNANGKQVENLEPYLDKYDDESDQ